MQLKTGARLNQAQNLQKVVCFQDIFFKSAVDEASEMTDGNWTRFSNLIKIEPETFSNQD